MRRNNSFVGGGTQKNIFAHVDLTKNLDILICLGAAFCFKVEKILKGSLDSIPSPSTSVKIQNMGGKVCLR